MDKKRVATHDSLIAVRNSPIHGIGVFATGTIPAGTVLAEYRGEIITRATLQQRTKKRAGNAPIYIFAIDDERFIDATDTGTENPARFINHACDENCEAIWNPQANRLEIYALRNICAGEEITFDYGFPLTGFFEHPCRCGSPKCVRYIVAKILRPALLRKLARHATRKPCKRV